MHQFKKERTTQRKDTFLGKWVKAIKRNKRRAGIRTILILLLVSFSLLFFMFYLKNITISRTMKEGIEKKKGPVVR